MIRSPGSRTLSTILALSVTGILGAQSGSVESSGQGCGGVNPHMAVSTVPELGQGIRIATRAGLPQTPGWLLFGAAGTTWNGKTLPIDLASVGMHGCRLYARGVAQQAFVTERDGVARFDTSIPGTPALVGARFQFQSLFIDPQANAGGMGATDLLTLTIGDTRHVQTVSEIQRHAITWRFQQPVQAGQYVNGDWWVKGPVDIWNISPRSLTSASRQMNGSMINPTPWVLEHGYDETMYGNWALGEYQPGLNAALDVSPSNLLTLRPGETIVSTGSVSAPGALPQLRTAAVLTCVAEIPPADAFRPPYCGSDKKSHHRERDIRWQELLTLPRVGSVDPALYAPRFERVWLDHIRGWKGRWQHPVNSMPDYGRDLSAEIGTAAVVLNMDFTQAEKRELLINFLQLGIDLNGIARNGGGWAADGGHASGRKLPILMAGKILGDSEMLNIMSYGVKFGEDGQTFRVAYTAPGVINYGHGGYRPQDVGLPEWGFQHDSSPSRDDRRWNGDPYRVCCTANCWGGHHLVALAMGLKPYWAHDEYFDYVDRFMGIEQQGTWTRQWSRFTEESWDNYRSIF